MLKRIVPALIAVLGAGPLWAASDGERGEHFDTVRQLISKELRLVAERAVDDFAKAGYNDPSGYYADGLRWYFADTFQLEVPELAKQADSLGAKLKASRDSLPPEVAGVFSTSGKVLRIANNISRRFIKPDYPPPLVAFNDEDKKNIAGLVELLTSEAEASMAAQKAAIDAHKPRVDEVMEGMDMDEKYWAVMREATMLRNEYCGVFYQAYKPLREIIVRGTEYGLSQEFIDGKVKQWLYDTLKDKVETLSEWDWSYGDYFPQLRHRLAVMMSEVVRLNKERGEGNELPGMAGYDDVRQMFYGGIEVDVSQYKDRATRDAMGKFKYEVWSDVLNWHLAMGDDQSLTAAKAVWQDLKDLSSDDRAFALDSNDNFRNMMAGHLTMVMGRIYHALGDSKNASSLMVDVQRNGNFFAGNAGAWLAYWANSGSESSSWNGQPLAMEPEQAYTLAQAFLAQARKATAKDQEEKFYLDAAATLRDGILGLPAYPDPTFIEFGPKLYQTLGYALYKRGYQYRAAAVVMEGLTRFQPEMWGEKPKSSNPWFKRGTITPSGTLVQRLAADGLSYAQGLVARTRSDAAKDAMATAIENVRTYDPASVEKNEDRMLIVIEIQQGEFRSAKERANKYADKMKVEFKKAEGRVEKVDAMLESLWGERMATRCQYSLWKELSEQETPNEKAIAEAVTEMQEMAEKLEKFAQYCLSDKSPVPDDRKVEAQNAMREVLTFRVAQIFDEGMYDQVLAQLNDEFWDNTPNDESLNRAMLSYLTGTVYRVNRDEAQAMNEAMKAAGGDVTKLVGVVDEFIPRMLKRWGDYTAARRNYARTIKRFPSIDAEAPGMRRQMAQVFNVTGRQAEFVTGNMEAFGKQTDGMLRRWLDQVAAEGESAADALKRIDAEAFNAADADADGELSDAEIDSGLAAGAALGAIEREAKGHFADLFEATITPDEKVDTILAVATTLWELDEKKRAARLFEMYKKGLSKDPAIAEFVADPKAVIDRIMPLMQGRSEFSKWWQYKNEGAIEGGAIPDLLYDDPSFMDMYKDPRVSFRDYPEVKASYGVALSRITQFEAEMEKVKSFWPGYEEASKALVDFKKLVRNLAYSVNIDTRLIEAYREMGELQKAVELARSLYKFDPKEPTYMATVVDGTLEAAREGVASKEALQEATEIAARLRNIAKNRSDNLNYWFASVQVLELLAHAQDTSTINNILGGYDRSRVYPSDDLFRPVPKDFDPATASDGYGLYIKQVVEIAEDGSQTERERIVGTIDRSAMQVVRRFIGLYNSISGIEFNAPLSITEVQSPDPEDPTRDRTHYEVRVVAAAE